MNATVCHKIINVIKSESTNVTNNMPTNVTNTVSINFGDNEVRYKIDYYILYTLILVTP